MEASRENQNSSSTGTVKSLVVVSCRESDVPSRSAISTICGRDAVHVSRGPWSAQNRQVVTLVTGAQNLDAMMRSLELAALEGTWFYAIVLTPGGDRIELWACGDGQLYTVGVDCDHELPGYLWECRDEAVAIGTIEGGGIAVSLAMLAQWSFRAAEGLRKARRIVVTGGKRVA